MTFFSLLSGLVGLLNTSPMWFINCPPVELHFLLAQLHLTLPKCSARASPSASLSDPKQHMILVKSQVTQCYSKLSSIAPARQEERTVRTRRQGKAQNEMGQGGVEHCTLGWDPERDLVWRGEENDSVLLKGILMDCPGESLSQWGGHGFPDPFARNSPKIHSWYCI